MAFFDVPGEGTVVSCLEASLRRGVSPFRGREAQRRLLGEAWERAVGGHGDAICLVGEPGIGKSRLAYELQRHLGLAKRVEGAAQAHARAAAYFAFRPPGRRDHRVLVPGPDEEVCDQLAHHWARSDRAVAALPYLMTAADGAVAIGANREAISHLEGALELTSAHPEAVDPPQRNAIRLKLAGLHFVVGER